MRVRVCVSAHMRARHCAYMRLCLLVCVCVCVRVCAYVRAYMRGNEGCHVDGSEHCNSNGKEFFEQ